jgi:magnesium transporter
MRDSTNLTPPEISDLIAAGKVESLVETLSHFHPADLADFMEHLGEEDAANLFHALPEDRRVETFELLEEDRQLNIIEHVGLTFMAPVIDRMSPDDRADLVKNLPPRTTERLLPLLAQAERADVKRLLAYPEETAGAIMSTGYANIGPDLSVAESLELLRRIAPHRETIYYVYVTGPERELLGFVSLQDLILAEPTQSISSLMNTDVISLPASSDQEEVAKHMEKYNFLALPINDERGRLVGIVTHDDILDVVEVEATEDAHLMGAVAPLENPYFRTSFHSLAWKRGSWLSLLFLAEMFTSTALHEFEGTLSGALSLVFFIPLIISSGGNSGSQSATLITRGLAVGDVTLQDWWRVTLRELGMGIFLGIFLAGLAFTRAWWVESDYLIASTVGLTMVGIVLFGTLVGSLLPLVFKRFGWDPAVTSSPFVASLVDIFGIVLYMNIAYQLMGSPTP